jgi:6-phosphogluconolactonase
MSGESFAVRAARVIAEHVSASVHARGRCALALTGGDTPRPVYTQLVEMPWAGRIPWPQVDIFFGDERAVPPDDPASNYRMARETLLDHVPVPPSHIHRMEAERSDRDNAAAEYAALLPQQLDVLLLGMGEDGHTASLFPGSPVLHEASQRVVAITGPKAPIERLTITPPVMIAATVVIVLVAGAAKAPVLARVFEGPVDTDQFPAQLALSRIWIVDDAAAAGLSAATRTMLDERTS